MNGDEPLPELDFCVIDTETTGGSPHDNRVIEIAMIQYRDGIIYDRFQTLIFPGRPIPEWITLLTGISNEMVRGAPRFEDIAPVVRRFLGRRIFCAHNVKFDYGFLRSEFSRLGETMESSLMCTLRLARLLLPELPSKNLGSLCEHFLIDIRDRHRAFGDAEATVYVLKNLISKAQREIGVRCWRELDFFQMGGALTLPEGLTFQEISRLPNKEGRYLFRDRRGRVVYAGTTKDIRRRVKTFFAKSNTSAKSNRFRQVVRAIEVLPNSPESARRQYSRVP